LAVKKQAAAGACLHHIEEIVPEFTHLLALRKGRMAYAKPEVGRLEAEMLARSSRLVVRKSASRYHLRGIRTKIGASVALPKPGEKWRVLLDLALVARPSNLFATRRRGNDEFSESARSPLCGILWNT
jgi:hypothetical protein